MWIASVCNGNGETLDFWGGMRHDERVKRQRCLSSFLPPLIASVCCEMGEGLDFSLWMRHDVEVERRFSPPHLSSHSWDEGFRFP